MSSAGQAGLCLGVIVLLIIFLYFEAAKRVPWTPDEEQETVLVALALLCRRLGYKVGLVAPEGSRGWHLVIDLPAGQVSWPVTPEPFQEFVGASFEPFDGLSVARRDERVKAWVRTL